MHPTRNDSMTFPTRPAGVAKALLPALLAAVVFMLAPARAADDQPRVEGNVTTRDGRPITNATVFVHTAKPRQGPSVTCPSCYPDCGKRTRTDAAGRFTISGLNPDLLFRLLVVAKGFRPDYVKDADPQFGTAFVQLRPLKISDVPPENRVTGKLIDPEGKPVAGATIDVEGARLSQYTTWGGQSGRVDPLAVSDENGEFLFNCTNDVLGIAVTIEGRTLAKRRAMLDTGKAHLIRLKRGVAVTGRLLHEGQPVGGATVSMSTQERESSVFMRGFEVATDKNGRFTLANIPANTRFLLYTKMNDMRGRNASLPPQAVAAGADDSVTKLGDLSLKPAFTLSGRAVLADGKPLPAATRIHLGLEDAWDYQETILAEDGSFDFEAVPAETVSLSIRIPGYRISARNPNKDWLNEGRMVGRLSGNLEDFIIHLEPGERFPRDSGPDDGGDRQPRNKPLAGAKL